jgi:predicted nuclease of restriction endonuclease-like RecB superfamily
MKKSLVFLAFLAVFSACGNKAPLAETVATELCDCAKDLIKMYEAKEGLDKSQLGHQILKMEEEAKKVSACMSAVKQKTTPQTKDFSKEEEEKFANNIDTAMLKQCPTLMTIFTEGM